LYGDADGKELPAAFADEAEHAEFARYTEKDWINLLDKSVPLVGPADK